MHKPPILSSTNLRASIAYYKDKHCYIKLFYNFSASEIVFKVVNNAKKILRTVRHDVQLEIVVALHIKYTKRFFQLLYRNGADLAA